MKNKPLKIRIDYLLVGILILAIFLNFYQLKNAGSNTYYTVAIKSMLQNFHAFFYGSFDPVGFITVDKPPVALWIQALSAYLFGLSNFSVLLPEALAGVISVWLIYIIVKPKFGRSAALISSLVLACTPIFVAVVRTNNVDSILILTLLIATCALMKSVEKQKVKWLIVSVMLVGIGFNIKMLQAFMVLPAFYLFYWLAVKAKWTKRLRQLLVATVVLSVVSLSWAVVVDLVPENERPYIGSSQTNSVLELALGYNGISRLTGNQGNRTRDNAFPGKQQDVSGASQDNSMPSTMSNEGSSSQFGNGGQPPNLQGEDGGRMGPGSSGGMFGTGNPSIVRLFSKELSGQISWLLPFVLFAVIGLFVNFRKTKEYTLQLKFATFWLAWLIPMMIFFSIAGFFHQYYLSMMGPAIAALTGIGWTVLWDLFKGEQGFKSRLLPLAVLGTFLFEALILYQNKDSISQIAIFGAVIVGVLLFTVLLFLKKKKTISTYFPLSGVLALLILPLYWTWITINLDGNSMTPIAGPSTSSGRMMGGAPPNSGQMGESVQAFGRQNGGFEDRETNQVSDRKSGGPESKLNSTLLAYLKKNYNGEKYFLATDSTQTAAPYMLKTDYAVMAMGGFSGSDPALTVEKLAKMAKAGEIKYFLVSGRGMGRSQSQSVTEWIKANCVEVPSSEWNSSNSSSSNQQPFGGMENDTLYEYKS